MPADNPASEVKPVFTVSNVVVDAPVMYNEVSVVAPADNPASEVKPVSTVSSVVVETPVIYTDDAIKLRTVAFAKVV